MLLRNVWVIVVLACMHTNGNACAPHVQARMHTADAIHIPANT